MINNIQETIFSIHTDTTNTMIGGTWMHGGFMWFGWIFAILLLIVLILLIIWLAQQLKTSNKKGRK